MGFLVRLFSALGNLLKKIPYPLKIVVYEILNFIRKKKIKDDYESIEKRRADRINKRDIDIKRLQQSIESSTKKDN